MDSPISADDLPDASKRRHPRSLPADVELLPWLALQLNISRATAYRLAQAGELDRLGVFKIGGQYRVSVVRYNREIRGDDGAPDAGAS
jgi:hypothetical protein